MKFHEYIKMLTNLSPELTEYFRNVETIPQGEESITSEKFYRIVLCKDPINTALDTHLVLRESLTKRSRELVELHPTVLKLLYMPSEMQYHTENDIYVLSGNGCMVTNGSPVILASRVTRSLTDNAIVIYQVPEWRTDRSLESMILNECKGKIIQDADLRSELTKVFSGIHINSNLAELATKRAVKADLFDGIDFEHERVRDNGTVSNNEYATMLKNAIVREFNSGFRRIFDDCRDVLMEYPAEVCFTGCYAVLECYKTSSSAFMEKIGELAGESAKRITKHKSIIERNTQRDKELKELEKCVSSSLHELKDKIKKQWGEINCSI
ncbi:hypothetical protein [uncultured Ruminococcus sp.]|uniref:hypothetical protein n=1 Tax=uncultured Ruminococcus sp. TaxID=165186 RepID=UPI0025FE92BC|nr:hypothetical protein [uncultured Ruminococcus sp.]